MIDHNAVAPSTARLRHPKALSVWAIVGSAASLSFTPLIIHETARDTNPFFFNMIVQLTLVLLLLTFLCASRTWSFRRPAPNTSTKGKVAFDRQTFRMLLRPATHMCYLSRSDTDSTGSKGYVSVTSPRRKSDYMKVPLIWTLLAGLDIGFLAWATNFVETAVATTVFELWPVFLVYALAIHTTREQQYRKPLRPSTQRREMVPREQLVLTLIAAVGLMFMLSSQVTDQMSSPLSLFNLQSILGLLLALMASILACLSSVGSLVYGTVLYYRLTEGDVGPEQRDPRRIEDRGSEARRLILWLTVLAVTLVRGFSLPIGLVSGVFTSNDALGLSRVAIGGAVLLGVSHAIHMVLLRLGNIISLRPAVNSIFFMTPAAALAMLMWVGIRLPRIDLFYIGAALIIAINVLIQAKPDEDRNYAEFGKESLPGTRLGFTAFILSIWLFGTIVYLRDEVMTSRWLAWSTAEYWTVIALSATVFALILGFRVARLVALISDEDKVMLSLFRDCDYLARRKVIPSRTRDAVAALDTARPRELLDHYNRIRDDLTSVQDRIDCDEDGRLLLEIEKQLDEVAHSKQQGRDIVELLSLLAFASVTIGLGLFARPEDLSRPDAAWSGFLSEIFILLFASTVAFLCINLFDVRRDREMPLIVALGDARSDYRLYFRHKGQLRVKYAIAIGISIFMGLIFSALLYNKWLS